MSKLAPFFQRNEAFARQFGHAELGALPRIPAIIVTCIDGRVDPTHYFGLEVGDAIVIRISGHLYDVATGAVRTLFPAEALAANPG